MDNLAHGLVGAALGRAVADRHVPLAGLIGAVAANAPDWTELLIGLPGPPDKYLVLHRGITHSLVGALVQILVLTLLVGGSWRMTSRPPWRRLLPDTQARASTSDVFPLAPWPTNATLRMALEPYTFMASTSLRELDSQGGEPGEGCQIAAGRVP